MMPLFDRDFIAQTLIIISVCVGAWMLTVKPKLQELGELEKTIAEASSSSAPVNQGTIDAMAAKMRPMHDRAAQILAFNHLADDSSRLYGALMDLADTHQVQVQSLQPGAAEKSGADGQVTSKRIEMAVVGSYEHVAAFLDSIRSLEAFVRTISLQVSPSLVDAQQLVAAEFSCEVLKFKLSDALAELGGQAHAQP